MTLSLNAYKAISDGIAQQQNANTSTFDAIQRARAEERQYLMDRLKWETDLGETKRDEIRQQLDNGFGLGGIVRNMLGMNQSNHDLAMDSSIGGLKPPAQVGVVGEPPAQKLNTQQQILDELKNQVYAGDDSGYKRNIQSLAANMTNADIQKNNIGRDNTKINQGMWDDVAKRFDANLKSIKRNEDAMSKAQKVEEKRRQVQAEKNFKSGNHYANVLASKGIIVPDKLTGKFADQTGQLEQIYGTVIDEAVRNNRWDDARKYNREFVTNMKSVYKSWREDPRGIQNLFTDDMIPKGKGSAKVKTKDITVRFAKPGDSAGFRRVKTSIPEDVVASGDEAVFNWLRITSPNIYGGMNIERVPDSEGYNEKAEMAQGELNRQIAIIEKDIKAMDKGGASGTPEYKNAQAKLERLINQREAGFFNSGRKGTEE